MFGFAKWFSSTCVWCGKDYDPTKPGAKGLYCSKKCEVEAKRETNFNGPYNPFA